MSPETEQLYKNEIEALKAEIQRLKNQQTKAIKREKYGLNWIDVPEEFDERSKNSIPILVEDKSKAIKNNDGKPTHILIEGDNYHALTCLNYTHAGKIDVIYIDPPYNTGSDGFTYKDARFLTEFPNGKTVPKDDPLRHSTWLSFMSKRLKLAKNLLSDKGVIFISIDDNEQANLKLLCDEIFGENVIEQYIWCLQDKTEGSFVKTAGLTIRKEHEYIIACFKKIGKRFKKYAGKREFSEGSFSNPDNDPRGAWFSGNISRNGIKSTTGSKYYTITNPAGESFTRNWTLSKDEYNKALLDGRIFFAKNGAGVPRLKIYENADIELIQSSLFNDVHTSITGKNELKELFREAPFNFPKPTTLIERLLCIAGETNSTILDFFAGSGTTMHATMKLNSEDGGNRQCILVQQPENDSNICESVTYERNRRVIQGYTNAKGEEIAGLGNSLKYYKTDFIGGNNPTKATDEDKITLAQKAGCLISLVENTLEEIETNNFYQIFSNADSSQFTGIYFNGDTEKLPDFVNAVESKNKPVTVYIFSWGNPDVFENEFNDLSNITIKSIPQPILEIYTSLMKIGE